MNVASGSALIFGTGVVEGHSRNLRNLCNLRIFNLFSALRTDSISLNLRSSAVQVFSLGGSTPLNHAVPGSHGAICSEIEGLPRDSVPSLNS
jgi:hypothetical protein